MKVDKILDQHFPQFTDVPFLKEEIQDVSKLVSVDKGTEILRTGGYIKGIPLLVSGLIKVFKEDESGNEVLLYYIEPGESCIMSVMTLMRNETSKVKAVVEKNAEIVLLPADKMLVITKKYPSWNDFIYDLFHLKFEELLHTIEILTFSNKDKRLLEYLKKEAMLSNSNTIKATHQHIAYDLGSSREVISRLLKKLEHDGIVRLKLGAIELTN
ncbi:MAG: Crp/Fnr family transcriptional regulator [Cellulophaga sp.]